jgi:flagellar biosynthesis chaperone FliJ
VLSAEIQGLALRRREVAEQVSLCRKALVKADQGVKVLEQLRERQLREFERAEEHREAREREEIWQAGRMRET